MKKTKPQIILNLCTSSNSKEHTDVQQDKPPKVKVKATYEVCVTKNIVYAEGLQHTSVNSADYVRKPLKLDIYEPKTKKKNRPAYMFIHGGSFINGSKEQEEIIHLAHYYATRGWVFISIDYRLKDDFGTVPEAWIEYAREIPVAYISQFLAMYPAQRDAKAAMRWMMSNAKTYGINTKYITVGGGSAGAITALSVAISNDEHFRDEIDLSQDTTLSTTYRNETYVVHSIIDYWGSKIALDLLEKIYGKQSFNHKTPPLLIVHGTEDSTVRFSHAQDLKSMYDDKSALIAYYPIEEGGHDAWDATVAHKRIETLAFDFIVHHQRLILA